MKLKRIISLILILLLSLIVQTGCSHAPSTGDSSPVLTDLNVFSFSEGSEDTQHVCVILSFDRPVAVSGEGKSLRITIAGERKQPELLTSAAEQELSEFGITVEHPENCVFIQIPSAAATNGILQISRAENAKAITDICSSDGRSAAADFSAEYMIPSGVTLSTVSRSPGFVQKEVTHSWNIRSIAWIGLFENGRQVPCGETDAAEKLEGYMAVHGHEFIIENEKDIAAKIADTLSKNYGEEYTFKSEGSIVTAEKEGSSEALDICILSYSVINGSRNERTVIETEFTGEPDTSDEQEPAAEENTSADADIHMEENALAESSAHTEGSKEAHDHGDIIRHSAQDREILPEEQALLDLLPSADYESTGLTPETADGSSLYRTIRITGTAMPETQIYSVKDLEELLALSYTSEAMSAFHLPAVYEGSFGLDLPAFLALCGADAGGEDLSFLCTCSDGTQELLSSSDLSGSVLVLTDPDSPFDILMPREGTNHLLSDVVSILIGKDGETPSDPGYGYHDHEPYLDSEDLTFTIEIYQSGMEYLGPVNTVTYTTKDLEDMMREYPEHVTGGYYSTIGNAENFKYVGVGSWFDYFEGPDLLWLLTEKAGIDPERLTGRAELYDRDLELFTTIDDLAYLSEAHEHSYDYYTLTSEGLELHGMIPMIGLAKNGAPILKDHTHEGPGYIAYNTLNETLNEAGIGTEIGVIKNHNGPFIACLGNRSGYYGGNEVETGNNCVLMKLYLNS